MTRSAETLAALGQAIRDRDARAAIKVGLNAAGPQRHVLMADLALRLARLGHAREVRLNVADNGDAAEALCSFLAERFGLQGGSEADMPEGANAQEAAGEAHGPARRNHPAEEAAEAAEAFGVISRAIVEDVRGALASGPLSFRALRARIGRRWRAARDALQALVDSGEVAREGERGRGVRFRLVADAGAPRSGAATDAGPSEAGPLVLPDTVYLELADVTDAPQDEVESPIPGVGWPT